VSARSNIAFKLKFEFPVKN